MLGAAGASSATHPVPKMLVAKGGLIHAFAQDTDAVAGIGPGYLVLVRRIGAKRGPVIGHALLERGPKKIHPAARTRRHPDARRAVEAPRS